jgi:hypothetical protein
MMASTGKSDSFQCSAFASTPGMKSLVVLLALSFTACAPVAPAPQSPQAETPANPAYPGPRQGEVIFAAERVSPSTIRLSLDNGTTQPIGYNLCLSDLQRNAASGWTRVETGDMCTMQLMTLNPGRDATLERNLPANPAAGEYRFVTGIERPLGSAQVRVATAPFRVDG